jgi:PadR family transcriptional regulator
VARFAHRRHSTQTVAVLRALAADSGRWRHGYDLAGEVGLKSGSLYPILMRLTDQGLLESRWELDPPLGRPTRHLYRVTAAGIAAALADDADAGALAARAPRPRPAAGG